MTSSISSGANSTVRRCSARAAGRRGTPLTVDLLAAAGLAGSTRGHAGARSGASRPPAGPAAARRPSERCPGCADRSDAVDPHEVGAPADQLGVRRGAVRPPQRQQDDGLEQRRLAGRVRTPDQLRPGPELEVERGVAPEIPDRQGSKERRRPATGSRPDLAPESVARDLSATYEVVLTGMTTWTYCAVADRPEDTGRKRPVQLDRELIGVDVVQDVEQIAGVEGDRRAVALDLRPRRRSCCRRRRRRR